MLQVLIIRASRSNNGTTIVSVIFSLLSYFRPTQQTRDGCSKRQEPGLNLKSCGSRLKQMDGDEARWWTMCVIYSKGMQGITASYVNPKPTLPLSPSPSPNLLISTHKNKLISNSLQ